MSLYRIDSLLGAIGDDGVDSIAINGFSSPDGPQSVNDRLAMKRGKALRSYLLWKYPGIDAAKIRVTSSGEYWDGIRQAAIDDSGFPRRAEVLKALDGPVKGDALEEKIGKIGNGEVYAFIVKNISPYLRSASTYTISFGGALSADILPAASLPADTILTVSSDDGLQLALPERTKASEVVDHTEVPEQAPEPEAPEKMQAKMPLWALKTNMLYWVALMPNIEGEYYFAPHWSANLALQAAWWRQSSKDRCYQIWMVTPEVRYWPGKRGAGNGLYFGLYATLGAYDLKNGRMGYWSESAWATGVGLGYVTRLRERLALEFGIGIGYLDTRYKLYNRYYPMGKHYVYQGTDRTTFLGPTKATVGLVWRFGDSKRQNSR